MPNEEQTYREWQRQTLIDIREQTIKTNGRVGKLEERQDATDLRWAYMKGAMAVVTALLVPVLLMTINDFI